VTRWHRRARRLSGHGASAEGCTPRRCRIARKCNRAVEIFLLQVLVVVEINRRGAGVEPLRHAHAAAHRLDREVGSRRGVVGALPGRGAVDGAVCNESSGRAWAESITEIDPADFRRVWETALISAGGRGTRGFRAPTWASFQIDRRCADCKRAPGCSIPDPATAAHAARSAE